MIKVSHECEKPKLVRAGSNLIQMISGLSRKKAPFVKEKTSMTICRSQCVCFATSLNIGSE